MSRVRIDLNSVFFLAQFPLLSIFSLDILVIVCYFVYDLIIVNIPMSNQKNLSIESLPDLLTVREVAEILRVSPLTIKRWGKRGKLPAIRINSRGDRRYKKEAVLWLLGIQQKATV